MARLSIHMVATTLILAAAAVASAEGRVLVATTYTVAAAGPAGALAHICDDLTFTAVCEALTKMPGVTTQRTMLEAGVRVSLEKARAAKGTFAEARKSSAAGNPMASILQSCDSSYDSLVGALEEAQRSIQSAHGSSNYKVVCKMTAASTFAGDCKNWYDERYMKSPYQAMQTQVSNVVSVTLGIAAKTKNL